MSEKPTLFLIGSILIVLLSRPILYAADGDFYLSFPLKDYTPYSVPISSVFDHSINGTTTESIKADQPDLRGSYDGVVIAYTGEQGTGTAKKGEGYQQQNGYIFRLHGNYVGATGGNRYLQYDGHPGYDYTVGIGTDVYAAADGEIIKVNLNENDPGGKYVRIEHKSESYHYQTQYLHLSETKVATGTSVYGGLNPTLIGKSGNTGNSGNTDKPYGAHLHFEVKKVTGDGIVSVDPYGWDGSNFFWSQAETSCSDDYEPNDSFNKSTKITSGSSYTGKICWSGDGDYFKIDVADAGTISLQLSVPSSKNYELELYDAFSVKRDGSFNGTGTAESITYSALSGGIYYIRIYGFKGDYDTTSTYTLSGTWPSDATESFTHTLTAPSKTTVSRGGNLGPFTVKESNNSSSYYSFYVQPYIIKPDGTTVNFKQVSTGIAAGKSRTHYHYLSIPSGAELGTFTLGAKLTDTSGNVIDDDSFEFTVVSSTAYASKRSDRRLKRLLRNPDAQVLEEEGWKVIVVPERNR